VVATHPRKIRLPSRLIFFYEYLLAAGADETEQKHLIKFFAAADIK